MPFQEGQIANPKGRPGYEFERQQLTRMLEVWDKFLALLEKAVNSEGEVDSKVVRKLQLLGPDMRKILDKLHASKQDVTSLGDRLMPIPIDDIEKNESIQEDKDDAKAD